MFRCHIVASQPAQTDEAAAVMWATPDDVRSLATEAFAVHILDAMSPSTAPAIRHHDGTHLLDAVAGRRL
ncbi:DNA mismatch repair protein MutT [Nonomuraea sp. CA-141351]|uniref:DNA mismatch repair protein MutT n=1 Tax=Nonomuraea sp. CA-141351 TaxID=3239996 RepID=UPI003D8E5C51